LENPGKILLELIEVQTAAIRRRRHHRIEDDISGAERPVFPHEKACEPKKWLQKALKKSFSEQ